MTAEHIVRNPQLQPDQFFGMITVSSKMTDFFELIRRVSRTEAAILIRGETGTGKEMVAQAIHQLSPRSSGPYNALNCATLTAELMLSELFGHVKGAFTGAFSDHRGLFEVSDGGTLFLDEVAEIPLNVQPRLLRVLQDRGFTRLGSTKTTYSNVRVIAATNEALRRKVERGEFRADLLYRIRVVPVFLPRLIERGRDIEVLLWRFIDEFNTQGWRYVEGIERRALDAMFDYSWPGNIRELRNNIEYAFAVGEGPVLRLTELTPELRGEAPPEGHLVTIADHHLQEKKRITEALVQANGHKSKAAEQLGISRATLWRKMKEFGLKA
jgi:two-component system response regulator AtoC